MQLNVFHPRMRFTCTQKFFHPGWVSSRSSIEVQIDTKNKTQTCSSCNHQLSRYYSSCITCSNNVLSLLKQFITQKVRSTRIFVKSVLFGVLTFWFHVFTDMVAEMLQKSNFLLHVLYSCYIKFYFDYIFHIYVICFLIHLLYIYMYIICYLILNFVIYFYFHIIWF